MKRLLFALLPIVLSSCANASMMFKSEAANTDTLKYKICNKTNVTYAINFFLNGATGTPIFNIFINGQQLKSFQNAVQFTLVSNACINITSVSSDYNNLPATYSMNFVNTSNNDYSNDMYIFNINTKLINNIPYATANIIPPSYQDFNFILTYNSGMDNLESNLSWPMKVDWSQIEGLYMQSLQAIEKSDYDFMLTIANESKK